MLNLSHTTMANLSWGIKTETSSTTARRAKQWSIVLAGANVSAGSKFRALLTGFRCVGEHVTRSPPPVLAGRRLPWCPERHAFRSFSSVDLERGRRQMRTRGCQSLT